MGKTDVIENLYSTFRKYTTSNMHYCDCGCIDPNDVKKLASKKLRELEEDDFCSYHGSALYTWGEIEHYKHFLPRILEVHNKMNGRGLIGLYELTTKLDYAKWETWEKLEVKAIKDFIITDWIEFVNERESDIGKNDLEYYSFFFEPTDLLKLWKIKKQGKGLRNFVHFFYYYGTEILTKGLKIKNKKKMKRINRLMTNICSDKLPESKNFYTKLFDFQVDYDSDWFVHLVAKDKQFEIGIIDRTNEIVPEEFQQYPQGCYITFVLDSADDVYEIAMNEGFDVLKEPHDTFYGQRRLLLKDPNGALVDVSSPIKF